MKKQSCLLVLMIIVLMSGQLLATKYARTTLSEIINTSTHIVQGEVISVESYWKNAEKKPLLWFSADFDEFFAHSLDGFGAMTGAFRVGIPAGDEAAVVPAKVLLHLVAVIADVLQRTINHDGLDINGIKKRDSAAKTLTEQFKPHILLLVHMNYIETYVY